MTSFPDLIVMMDDLLDHGDKVIYKWTLAGTNWQNAPFDFVLESRRVEVSLRFGDQSIMDPEEPEKGFESPALRSGSSVPISSLWWAYNRHQ
jgi:hypothetical protein